MSNDPEFPAILPVGLIRETFDLTIASSGFGTVLEARQELFIATTQTGKRFRGSATTALKVLDMPESGSYPANTSTLGRFAWIGGHGQPVVRKLATLEDANYPLTVSALQVLEGSVVEKGDPVCELCDSSGQKIRMRSPEAGRILHLGFSEKDTIAQRSEFVSLQTERLEVPAAEAVKMFSWNITSDIESARGTTETTKQSTNQTPEFEKPNTSEGTTKRREKERTPPLSRLWSVLFFGSMAVVLMALFFGERLSSGVALVSQTYQRMVGGVEASTPSANTSSHVIGEVSKSIPGEDPEPNSDFQSTPDPEMNAEPAINSASHKAGTASEELELPDGTANNAPRSGANYFSLSEMDHGDQRLVLGVPEQDVAAFLRQIVNEGEYGFEAVDVYASFEEEPLYNFILGPPNNDWWVAHCLPGDFYPTFIAEREAEGYRVVSSEPFLFQGKLHFAALLSKQLRREQLRFVMVAPREGEIVFRRDFSTEIEADYIPEYLEKIEGNYPIDLPFGYTLKSMRPFSTGLATYVSLIYEKPPEMTFSLLHYKMVVGRSFQSLRLALKEHKRRNLTIGDFQASLGQSFPRQVEYSAIFTETSEASGLEASPAAQLADIFKKYQGQRLKRISAVIPPSRSAPGQASDEALFWVQFAP